MGKTQPAISKMLKAIEEELGLSLFTRGATGIRPTLEASAIIERCQRISRDMQDLRRETQEIDDTTSATVRLCVSPYVAYCLVPKVVQRFLKRMPAGRVEILDLMGREAEAMLSENLADIAVGPSRHANHSTVSASGLLKMPFAFVVRSGSSLVNISTSAEFHKANWGVISVRATHFNRFISPLFSLEGLEPPEPKYVTTNFPAMMEAITQLDLICVMPYPLFQYAREKWNVTTLATKPALPNALISVMIDKNKILTPGARLFIDLLNEEAAKLPWTVA